ncbi:hypothetical protein ACFL5V_06285 [Fibrobacterota bacterium]
MTKNSFISIFLCCFFLYGIKSHGGTCRDNLANQIETGNQQALNDANKASQSMLKDEELGAIKKTFGEPLKKAGFKAANMEHYEGAATKAWEKSGEVGEFHEKMEACEKNPTPGCKERLQKEAKEKFGEEGEQWAKDLAIPGSIQDLIERVKRVNKFIRDYIKRLEENSERAMQNFLDCQKKDQQQAEASEVRSGVALNSFAEHKSRFEAPEISVELEKPAPEMPSEEELRQAPLNESMGLGPIHAFAAAPVFGCGEAVGVDQFASGGTEISTGMGTGDIDAQIRDIQSQMDACSKNVGDCSMGDGNACSLANICLANQQSLGNELNRLQALKAQGGGAIAGGGTVKSVLNTGPCPPKGNVVGLPLSLDAYAVASRYGIELAAMESVPVPEARQQEKRSGQLAALARKISRPSDKDLTRREVLSRLFDGTVLNGEALNARYRAMDQRRQEALDKFKNGDLDAGNDLEYYQQVKAGLAEKIKQSDEKRHSLSLALVRETGMSAGESGLQEFDKPLPVMHGEGYVPAPEHAELPEDLSPDGLNSLNFSDLVGHLQKKSPGEIDKILMRIKEESLNLDLQIAAGEKAYVDAMYGAAVGDREKYTAAMVETLKDITHTNIAGDLKLKDEVAGGMAREIVSGIINDHFSGTPESNYKEGVEALKTYEEKGGNEVMFSHGKKLMENAIKPEQLVKGGEAFQNLAQEAGDESARVICKSLETAVEATYQVGLIYLQSAGREGERSRNIKLKAHHQEKLLLLQEKKRDMRKLMEEVESIKQGSKK